MPLKKELIVTVAGTATRFNKDLSKETLKCLYYEQSPAYTLLKQILVRAGDYDKIVIVGGYLYEDLKRYQQEELSEWEGKIKLVYNPYYREYGSGYSLLLGIKALDDDTGAVTFVEGDLFFDKESFKCVHDSKNSVLTVNREFILSNKAVALYIDEQDKPHYIYDTGHKSLCINEPFKAIYNSGQIWQFSDIELLRRLASGLNEKEEKGTNLIIIQKYLDAYTGKLEIIPIKTWHNCNTVADYNRVYDELKEIR